MYITETEPGQMCARQVPDPAQYLCIQYFLNIIFFWYISICCMKKVTTDCSVALVIQLEHKVMKISDCIQLQSICCTAVSFFGC